MSAGFSYPHGVAVDSLGNVLVADTNNFRVRSVSPDGVTTSLQSFSGPTGVAVDLSGNVYVAESYSYRVRVIFAVSASALCDSTWHHVALTHGDGSPTATATYVDGALASTATQTLALPSDGYGVLSVGSNGLPTSTGLAQLFNGSLAELRLYNRSLTASEVIALSQPLLPVNPSPLVVNPTLQPASTSYAWKCAAGYFGGPATLTRSPVDGSWSSSGFPLACSPCPASQCSLYCLSSIICGVCVNMQVKLIEKVKSSQYLYIGTRPTHRHTKGV
jgi:hypothetical protein